MTTTKGILLAGGRGTRLKPITNVLNKQLIPIYDKPMIYYPLATLMLCGVREIALITNADDLNSFKNLLGNGNQFGLKIEYFIQRNPNGLPEAFTIASDFISGSKCVLMLGDNLLIGQGLGSTLENHVGKTGASILAFPVNNPEDYGVVEFDNAGQAKNIVEKPQNPNSNFAIPGIYFVDENVTEVARKLRPSKRGELEIVDLLNSYLDRGQLKVTKLDRGTGWMDAGTVESLYAASELVRVLQNRQGYRFNVPEEIAFRKGWIEIEQIQSAAIKYSGTEYGKYLQSIVLSNK